MRVLEDSYNDMIKSNWDSNSDLISNMEDLKDQVNTWNMHTIKSVKKEKNKIMVRL